MIPRLAKAGHVCARCQLRSVAVVARPFHRPTQSALPVRPALRFYSDNKTAGEAAPSEDGSRQPGAQQGASSEPDAAQHRNDATDSWDAFEALHNDPPGGRNQTLSGRPRPFSVPENPEQSVKGPLSSFDPDTPGSASGRVSSDMSQGMPARESPRRAAVLETPNYPKKKYRGLEAHPTRLGGSMLGEKAYTIVMKDPVRVRRQRAVEEDPEFPKTTNPKTNDADLMAFLAESEANISLEEVMANIDELRPQAALLPRCDFWALHNDLSRGFTANQLLKYMHHQRKTSRARPSASGSGTSIQPLEKIEAPSGMGAKERKALVLMLDIWKVDIWERIEGLSHLSIAVDDPATSLALTLGNERNPRLEGLRAFLQAGESLVWLPEVKRLDIRARRAVVEIIRDQVGSINEDVAEGALSLFPASVVKSGSSGSVIARLLNQLCQHTHAAYTFDRTAARTGMIRALWLKSPQEYGSPHLENTAHIMWRLLYSAHANDHSTPAVKPELVSDKVGKFIPHAGSQEELPWKDRLASWSRWVLPIQREPSAPGSGRFTASNIAAFSAPTFEQSPPERSAVWTSVGSDISATFGHILFDAEQHRGSKDPSLHDNTGHQRILAPVAPPPNSTQGFQKLLHDTNNRSASASLVLRFVLGPDHTKGPLLDLNNGHPTIHPASSAQCAFELHLGLPAEIPGDGILTWEQCTSRVFRAVLKKTDTDLLLGDQPVDIRMSRAETASLLDTDLSSPLREFINASRLQFHDGSLLTQPTLRMPHDILRGLNIPNQKIAAAGEEATLEFVGLELRRAVDVEVEGHLVSYTSIEAGLHGGRRSELSLRMNPAGSDMDAMESRQRFLDLAVSVAEGRLVHWGDGPQNDLI